MSNIARIQPATTEHDSIDGLLERVGLDDVGVASIERVTLLACSASANAAAVGLNWIEYFARLPASIELLPTHDFAIRRKDLVVVLSHEGESPEIRAAVRTARSRALAIMAIGLDGVAHVPDAPTVTTKRFMGQLDGLLSLAVALGCRREHLSASDAEHTLEVLRRVAAPRERPTRRGA
jgi:glucosamine--fructose-6-phosphate aminotransferase (isomerizing)